MRRHATSGPATSDIIIARRSRRQGGSDLDAYMWGRWLEWCNANDKRPIPATERLVRRFLHAQINYWGEPTMRAAADAIADAHRLLGLDDPTEGKVRAYLGAAARTFGGPREAEPVAPVRVADALHMCGNATTTPVPRHKVSGARQRLALAAVRDQRIDHSELAEARIDTASNATWLGLVDGTRLELAHDRHPQVERAARYLRSAGKTTLGTTTQLRVGFRNTMARAGTPVNGPLDLTALSDEDIGWLDLFTDPHFLLELRDKTLLIVGVALARRGIELGAFDRADFDSSTTGNHGFDVMLRNSKTDRSGRGIRHFLGHLDPNEEHPWCPACALATWLYVLERRHGQPWTGPLFPARVLGPHQPRGRLSTQNVRLIVKRLWERAGLDSEVRIASRSLRIGGATSGYDAGMTTREIADELTKHICLEACSRYIRPRGGQFHLPV